MTVKEAIIALQTLESIGKGDCEIFVPDWSEGYAEDGKLSGFCSTGNSTAITIEVL